MSKITYFPPEHIKGEYHCPHCQVFAEQKWSHISAVGDAHSHRNSYGGITKASNIYNLSHKSMTLSQDWTVSFCEHCRNISIWHGKRMIYPKTIQIESPNTDLSKEIQRDYLEAANILNDSPRAAAAILRLALQKLCIQLGEKGHNINDDIASLVKKGLNPTIQKSLDALRITGNNSVHPGEIDLTEDVPRVTKMFNIVNFIAQKMITEQKEIAEFYAALPTDSKEAIKKRDGAK